MGREGHYHKYFFNKKNLKRLGSIWPTLSCTLPHFPTHERETWRGEIERELLTYLSMTIGKLTKDTLRFIDLSGQLFPWLDLPAPDLEPCAAGSLLLNSKNFVRYNIKFVKCIYIFIKLFHFTRLTKLWDLPCYEIVNDFFKIHFVFLDSCCELSVHSVMAICHLHVT